jgi:outer membrane lipoprotein-sorting protein
MSNQSLTPGQSIASSNGLYTFIYQSDGNLVLYKNYISKPKKALWASNTAGRPGRTCIMQGDGNLVIYDGSNRPIWSTNTWREHGSHLIVQDDGNVVIYRPDNRAVWATNTVQRTVPNGPTAQGNDMLPGEVLRPNQAIISNNGRYTFIYQSDGNLVLYQKGVTKALWASNTNGRPGFLCIMQADGNLVIYDEDGNPIWSTDTWREHGSHLVVQDDGNVVIYRPDNRAVWATNTVRVFPDGPTAQGDAMLPGEILRANQSLKSKNGKFTFIYQADGNLVLYQSGIAKALWASDTQGSRPGTCIFQW